MIVMSPRYLNSRWCNDELEWFREQVRERSNDQGRVFVVRALPTKESTWPDFLRDEGDNSLVGFLFHDPITKKPYGWRDIGEAEYVRHSGRCRPPRNAFGSSGGATKADPKTQSAETQPAKAPSSEAQPAPFFAPAASLATPSTRVDGANGKRRIYIHARGNQAPARTESSACCLN